MAVRVVCPHCQASLGLRDPNALGSRVACPKCREPFVPSIAETEEDRSEKEIPVLKRPSQFQPYRRGRPNQRREVLSADRRWLAAAALGIIVVTVCLFVFVKPHIVGALGRVIPVADSADSILDEVVRIERDIQRALEAIQNADEPQKQQVRRAAIDLLKKPIQKRADELWLRAARPDPVSDEEYSALMQRHEDRMKGVNLFESGGRLLLFGLQEPGSHSMVGPELNSVQELRNIESLVLAVSKKAPQPRDELEKNLSQKAAIEREMLKRLSYLDSAAQLEQAIPFITEQTQRLSELSEQALRIVEHGPVRLPDPEIRSGQFSWSVSHAQMILTRILSSRYGNNGKFDKAVFDFGWARTNMPRKVPGPQMVDPAANHR